LCFQWKWSFLSRAGDHPEVGAFKVAEKLSGKVGWARKAEGKRPSLRLRYGAGKLKSSPPPTAAPTTP
jgi:hypothetical protein